MMNELAYCEDLGDRLVVVNANPLKRNVLSPEYCQVVVQAMSTASTEPRIGAVILRGEGNFFCAGGDLQYLRSGCDMTRDERLDQIEQLHDVIRAVVQCTKPVIAAIEGGAAGAGLSIAFACDLVLASATAQFSVAYVKAGLVPDGALTHHLAQLVPRATLMHMALLGEPTSGQRLFDLGALSELVHDGKALDSAHVLADKLIAGPSATQSRIKALVQSASNGDFEAQLARERDAMADALADPEAREGISSFLEKRAPDFSLPENG